MISSFFITLLSHLFYSKGPEFTGGIYYIGFSLLYGLTLFLSFKKYPNNFKRLSLPFFILGCLILSFGWPLFENDHYRYLWEGKILLKGFNPYILAPNSETLNHINFTERNSIGFQHLPSLYPPLGLAFFSIGSFLSFKWNLILQMVMNSVLTFLLFNLIKEKVKIQHLVLLFPFFQKEFIQSIHIDLFAFIFLVPLFIQAGKTGSLIKSFKFLGLIFLSYWIKLLGILILPFLWLKIKKNDRPIIFIISLIIFLSLPVFMSLFIDEISQLKGALAFSQRWTWNPGFFSLLNRLLGFSFYNSRIISLISFAVVSAILFLTSFKLYKRQNDTLSDRQLLTSIYLLFSSLMFFTPVYNPWYAIWFLVPALLLQNKSGILYGFFSCCSYISYGNPELRPVSEFLSHIWFLFSLREILIKDYPKLSSRMTFFIKGPFFTKKS